MKRHVQLMMMIGLAVATTGCQTLEHSDAKLQAKQRWNQVRGRVKYQLAQQQWKAGLFDEAVPTAVEAIALDPTQADAYVLLARANLELGKPASAQRALDRAGCVGLTSADLDYMRGVILEQRDQLEAAATMYAKARTLDPNNVDYLVAQAECLVAADRPGEALELLHENADRLDDDGTLSALAGHVAVLLGDYDQASKQYAQALIARPDSRLIAEELGRLLVRARRYDHALAVLRPFVESSGDTEVDSSAQRTLATCYLALGDPASAKLALAEYARTHPDDTHAQLLLAKAAILTNDVMTALRAIDLAQQREPDHPELLLVRSAIRWKRGKLAAAASDLYDVLQNNPNDLEAHCLLAEVLQAQQRFEAASTHFREALKINPQCAWATAGLKALAKARPPVPTEPSPRLTSAMVETIPADP
ncbi:MAG: tetratricopeptide repeat protein [Phycisphaerae bacterium]